jgi:hypothetical protein
LSVLLAAGLIWRWHDPYRRYRRAALRELRRIDADSSDPVITARAIQNLLRRFAITIFGGERVAGLVGSTWLRFVACEGGELLDGDAGRSLLNAAFGGESGQEASSRHREQWLAAADAFIQRAARRPRRASPSDPSESAQGKDGTPQPARTSHRPFPVESDPLERGPSPRGLK